MLSGLQHLLDGKPENLLAVVHASRYSGGWFDRRATCVLRFTLMCPRQPTQAVVSPEADVGWLVDWRDRIAEAESLTDPPPAGVQEPEDPCERLTRGFIACNLIIDIVDFLGPLLRRSFGAAILNVTFAQLDDAMQTGTLPAETASLQGPEAYQEWQQADSHHPWRRINRWLALEAILRGIPNQPAQLAVSVSNQALQTFVEPFPLVSMDPPEVCRSRSSLSVEAFQRWFDLTANCLAGLLAESILPERQALAHPEQRPELAQVLADGLCIGPLVQLVKAKNEQLRACIARLNRGTVYYPVEAGWVASIAGRVLHAHRARHDFWWGRWWDRYTGRWLGHLVRPGADCFNLGELLAWLRNHPEAEDALGRAVETTLLWEISTRCPSLVAWEQLQTVLDELEAVERLVRRRGLPGGFGEAFLVCDLFFHPLSDAAGDGPGVQLDGPPPRFSFNQWYNDVTVPAP